MNNDYEKELKSELDAIPQDLKDTFVPRIKELFNKLNQISIALDASPNGENDPDLQKKKQKLLAYSESIFNDFKAAGGIDKQWNVLSPAVSMGEYDALYPNG